MTGIYDETQYVGTGPEGRSIAVKRRTGHSPGLYWLGGLRSGMDGTKATALDAFGADRGLAVTRFDYSGHGRSSGTFEKGTISRWAEEAAAVFDTTRGPQILVGSSMGSWMALLTARSHIRARGHEQSRIVGMVLIAPAADFTEDLLWGRLSENERSELMRDGTLRTSVMGGDSPLTISRRFIEDGRKNLVLRDGPIVVGCPVAILHGKRDETIPWMRAVVVAGCLTACDVSVTLIDDGDHRLARITDIDVLLGTVEALLAKAPTHGTLPGPESSGRRARAVPVGYSTTG